MTTFFLKKAKNCGSFLKAGENLFKKIPKKVEKLKKWRKNWRKFREKWAKKLRKIN